MGIRDTFGRALEGTVRHSGACPDCDSSLRAMEIQPHVFVAVVAHDSTCPRYRQMKNGEDL